MTCRIRLMQKKDIPQVSAIDREAFPTMWPPVNFQHELTNRLAHYAVTCDGTRVETDPPQPAAKSPVRSFLNLKWLFRSEPAKEADTETIDYITGFVGLWTMVDEAHIINIAVKEAHRGKGLGELLLIASLEMAARLDCLVATLEVRASNTVAQNLYSKYGFQEVGVRRGYYTDNKEDALIMTTDALTSEAFKQRFIKLKESRFQKLGRFEYQIE